MGGEGLLFSSLCLVGCCPVNNSLKNKSKIKCPAMEDVHLEAFIC